MTKLAPFVDVCIANEEDALNVFGIQTQKTNVDDGIIDRAAFVKTAEELKNRFGFKKIAITLRQSINADNNNWSALFYDGKESVFSKIYSIHIVVLQPNLNNLQFQSLYILSLLEPFYFI